MYPLAAMLDCLIAVAGIRGACARPLCTTVPPRAGGAGGGGPRRFTVGRALCVLPVPARRTCGLVSIPDIQPVLFLNYFSPRESKTCRLHVLSTTYSIVLYSAHSHRL